MRNANEGVSLSEIVTKATLRKFGIRGVNKYEKYTVIIITVAFFILESAAGRAKDTFAVAIKVLSYMLPCTAIIMAVIWIIFFIGDRREKLKHAELDVIKIKARQKIYDRLRYVENEHIVFDPVTGREVPAERTCINELVEALAMEATT